ncbi:MAG: 4'-phosphopantetheinyl transferase superfamily protein [Bacteroidota bacterium]
MLEVGVYITHPLAVSARKSIHQLLEGLPYSMHPRALRYRRIEDAYNFILGRMLLQRGLKDLEINDSIEDIKIAEDGKPFLPSVFFNISHTSNRVVCAISQKGRIGIDIEEKKEVELKNFESWFTAKEWKAITESEVSLLKFYRYWTRKESIIKALGLKLSYLNQIELDIQKDVFEENGKKWYLTEIALGADYKGSLCSEFTLELPIQMKYIDF